MSFLEKIWGVVSISIIFIILSTNPKTSATGSSVMNNKMTSIFSSASEGQKFIYRLNWMLIAAFFLLTLSLSFFN
jgi:protein translocase SecG subunit